MPRKRYTRDEARAAVLAAGLELLVERGPSAGLQRVSFAQAITRSGVPRPSAYRAFRHAECDPQQHFRDELAMQVIERSDLSDVSATMERIAPLCAEAERDDVTSEELTALLREVVRVAAATFPSSMADEPYLHAYITLVAASRGFEGGLTTAMRKAETEATVRSVEFYRPLANLFGIRLKPGWNWEMFAAAVASIEAGDYLMGGILPHQGPVERPTGPSGELQEWTVPATLVEGLVVVAFEPNPRMVVSADPSAWNR